MALNLNKYGPKLKEAYEDVVSDHSDTTWAVFGYEGSTNELKVVETGDGDIDEMAEEMSGGKVMYAFVRVIDPNTKLPKFVLINWMGEGVPSTRKGVCARHVTDVGRFLRGAHVTINARNEDDIESSIILDKVAKSSGANFSFHKEKAKAIPEQGQIGSVYKKANPQQEINVKSRDEFWNKQDKSEEQRVAEEKRSLAETRKQEELERREREKESQKQRDQITFERGRAIESQRKQEMDRIRQEKEANEAALQNRLKERENQVDKELEREKDQSQRQKAQDRSVSSGVRAKLAGFEQKAEEQRREPPRPAPKRVVKPPRAKPEPEPEPEPQYEPEPELEPQYEPEPEPQYEPEPEPEPQYEPEPEPEYQYEPEPEPQYEPEPEPEPQYEPEPEPQYEPDEPLYDDYDNQPQDDIYDDVNDVQNQQTTADEGLVAISIYDYEAEDDTEISFDVDEQIIQIEQIDEGWWRGIRKLDGSSGLFPANYVELIN